MSILSEIFSWWGGTTWGTRLTIWGQGKLVGKDDYGNAYYEQRRGSGPLGAPRRWVTYGDFAEPSKVPAEWHGWLHHTSAQPPMRERYHGRPWQTRHVMNKTGTREAYRPKGSILSSARRPKATGDYAPWRPD